MEEQVRERPSAPNVVRTEDRVPIKELAQTSQTQGHLSLGSLALGCDADANASLSQGANCFAGAWDSLQ
jgi:hypothetical protein